MAKRNGFRKRFDFSKIPATIQIPNLIEVQKRSYERFLQMDRLPSERDDGGLQSVFQSVFPITDFRNVSQLEFVDYSIGNWECKCGHLKGLHHLRTTCKNCGNTVITDPFHPGDVLCHKCGTYNANTPDFCNKCGDPVGLQLKYDVAECEERGMTYSAPLKVTMRLTIFDKDEETGNRSIRDIKEQEVFFGDVPLMSSLTKVKSLCGLCSMPPGPFSRSRDLMLDGGCQIRARSPELFALIFLCVCLSALPLIVSRVTVNNTVIAASAPLRRLSMVRLLLEPDMPDACESPRQIK